MMKGIENLKQGEVTMDQGVLVNNTKILDGGAMDSPVFDQTNTTKQYSTPSIPKDNLGGRNNLNG